MIIHDAEKWASVSTCEVPLVHNIIHANAHVNESPMPRRATTMRLYKSKPRTCRVTFRVDGTRTDFDIHNHSSHFVMLELPLFSYVLH